MLAHVPSLGRNPRGSSDFVAYPVPKACMHVLGTRVPRCVGVARSASSPKAAQVLGCSRTARLWSSIGRVTCMARAVSVPGLWTLGFLLLRGACVWVWVVVGLGFPLRTPHSWLGCWGVCVLVCRFRLYLATPGWGVPCGCVRVGSGFSCTPPLLAGVLECVSAGARAPPVPRHSWLGCAVCLCVFVCALRLYPATPGWGVRCGCVCLGSSFGCAPPLLAGVLGCACLCACPPCSPPLLAGVCGVGVCAWARVSVAPRHSWLGCLGVCVLVCALALYPATPGWGVRCGCGCLGSGFGCAPPLLAGVLGCACCVRAPSVPRHSWPGCAACVCVLGLGIWPRPASPSLGVGVCVLVCMLPLYPATPGWGVRRGCACLGSGCSCAPPLLAGVLGCVCAGVSAPPVPRLSWLGCAV